MPATRSSGPPSAAALQPVLLEALENFKQKHSKQNQDLIHKNRVLLKANAELERVVKELKNENLDLRVAARKAQSINQNRNITPQFCPSTRSNSPLIDNERIRAAVTEITAKCRALEASLESALAINLQNAQSVTPRDESIGLGISVPNLTSGDSTFVTRSRAELIALRERRRSQLPNEAEESRLSFIHECSGAEDKSESMSLESRQIEGDISNLPKISIPSSSGLVQNDAFVAQRSNRRQNALMTCIESPTESSSSAIDSPRQGSISGKHRADGPDGVESEEEIEAELNIDAFALEKGILQSGEDGDGLSQESIEKFSDSDGDEDTCGFQSHGSRSDSSELSSPEPEPSPKHSAEIRRPSRTNARVSRSRNVGLVIQSKRLILDSYSSKEKELIQSDQILNEISHPTLNLSSNQPLLPQSSDSVASKNSRRRRNQAPEYWKHSQVEPESVLEQRNCRSKLSRRGCTGLKRGREAENKDEEEEKDNHSKVSVDEGWSKDYNIVKKKRSRAELDAVKEEQPNSGDGLSELPINLSGAGQREARRARKERIQKDEAFWYLVREK
ncbi:hypothetical protein BY996DRAFT_6416160 [Phakopsora pachyrhizi]|nr:hypothetical protein BY996DRAFT_6416160 [Phakopsora pachyrhizi]